MLSRLLETESDRRAHMYEAQRLAVAKLARECIATSYAENQNGVPRFLVFHLRLATLRERLLPEVAINLWPSSWKDFADSLNSVVEKDIKKDPAVSAVVASMPRKYKREILGEEEDVVEFRYEFHLFPVAQVVHASQSVVNARAVE